jgi:hypothetical protein
MPASGKERLPSCHEGYGAINLNVATSTQLFHEETGGGGSARVRLTKVCLPILDLSTAAMVHVWCDPRVHTCLRPHAVTCRYTC